MCMTADKFNCTVPGTLPTNTSQCPLSFNEMTTVSLSNTQHTSLPLTSSMATVMERGNENRSHFQIGSPLFYIVMVISVGVIVILSCVIGASLVLCVRHGRESTSKYNQ